MVVRHSKIQKQILSLYKEFLQASKNSPGLSDYIKNQFRKNATLPRQNFIQIEQLYRRGQRQLEMLKREDVQGASVFSSKNKGQDR